MRNIQQQYYTKTKNGLISKTEGYDTIAKSHKLDDDFIIEVLHKICVYKAPYISVNYGNKVGRGYPEVLTCIHASSGELIIGKTIYRDYNISGEQDQYFVHNYIIPEDMKKPYIMDVRNTLYINSFAEQRGDFEQLEEVEFLPYNGYESRSESPADLFKKLGITDYIFKNMVYSIIMSAVNKRRVYIRLNAPIGELFKYSRLLLEYLLDSVPYEIRGRIGFTTYRGENLDAEHINIAFISEIMKATDREALRNGYVFDFRNNETKNFGSELNIHSYLDFIIRNLENPRQLEKYYEFIDEIFTKEVDGKIKTSINIYDKLLSLYMNQYSAQNTYLGDRDIFLHILNELLGIKGINMNKIEEIFEIIIRHENQRMNDEKIVHKPISSIKIVVRMFGVSKKIDVLIEKFIVKCVELCDLDEITLILEEIKQNSALEKSIITELFGSYAPGKEKLITYIKDKIKLLSDIEDIKKFITGWLEVCPKITSDEQFIHSVEDRINLIIYSIINNSQTKLTMVDRLIEMIEYFCNRSETETERLCEELKQQEEDIFKVIFDEFDIEKSTPNQIKTIENMYTSIYGNCKNDEKLSALMCLWTLLEISVTKSEIKELSRQLLELSKAYSTKIQNCIRKRIYNDLNETKYFGRILISFLDLGQKNNIYFDLKSLFKAINENSNGNERKVMQFLFWFVRNHAYNTNDIHDIEEYLFSEDSYILRNKELRTILLKNDYNNIFKNSYKRFLTLKKTFPKRILNFFIQNVFTFKFFISSFIIAGALIADAALIKAIKSNLKYLYCIIITAAALASSVVIFIWTKDKDAEEEEYIYDEAEGKEETLKEDAGKVKNDSELIMEKLSKIKKLIESRESYMKSIVQGECGQYSGEEEFEYCCTLVCNSTERSIDILNFCEGEINIEKLYEEYISIFKVDTLSFTLNFRYSPSKYDDKGILNSARAFSAMRQELLKIANYI